MAYDLVKSSPIARLNVAASVAPPLLEILETRNFVLYVYGKTGGGKSTAALLGASAIGNHNDLIISFDATNNGLLAMAAETNDYPFFVDEKQSADQKLKRDFIRFIYSVANGKGRARADKEGNIKPIKTWRNITIANGETVPTADNTTGGANTRLLAIIAPTIIN